MWLEWLAGRWQVALSHIAEAKELAEQAQDEFLGPQLVNQEAFIEARLGRIEEARAKAESVLAVFAGTSSEIHRIVCLSTLGHIELALGNLEAADRYLHDLPGQLLSFGWLEPGHPLWPDAIETLVGVGKLDQARAYLEQHERLAARAGRLARGYAARCRGLLAAAEGDLVAAFESFERGLAELDGLYAFERGRTLLALGSARRQAKQKRLAREALEQALALFEELGARLWAENARAELRRISGRRPGTHGPHRDGGASRTTRRAGAREQTNRGSALHQRPHRRSRTSRTSTASSRSARADNWQRGSPRPRARSACDLTSV